MSADIILALSILVFVAPVAWLTLRWLGEIIARRRQVTAYRNREPETYGDAGGVPIQATVATIEKRSHVTRMPR